MRIAQARGTSIAVFVAVVAASLAAALWLLGYVLTRPAPAVVGAAPAGMFATEFDSDSGATLRAWIAPVSDARAVVVLMHPLRANRRSMQGRMQLLQSLGVAALAFDFSAHGESTGDTITFGHLESLDARAAVGFARQRWPDLPLVVVGVSLGGAAALLADPPLDVAGMILESVYPDIATAAANRLAMRFPYAELATPLLIAQLSRQLGFDPSQLAPADRAPFITVPVLIMSGSHDRRTTEADTRRLVAAFREPTQLVLFEGARHQNLRAFDTPRYDAVVADFLESTLADPVMR